MRIKAPKVALLPLIRVVVLQRLAAADAIGMVTKWTHSPAEAVSVFHVMYHKLTRAASQPNLVTFWPEQLQQSHQNSLTQKMPKGQL